MARVTLAETIDATPSEVWAILSDIQGLPEREEAVEKIEFLGYQKSGVGTQFRETRSMGNRTVETELKITEWEPDESIRFVSDTGGTIWDTVYRCLPDGNATRLEIDMEARPQKLVAKLMLRLILPVVRKGMKSHLASLKAFCESAG